MANSSNPFNKIDWVLFIPMLILMIIGILFIFSSGISSRGIVVSNEYLKQIIWMALGLIIVVFFSQVKYELYRDFAIPIFIIISIIVVITSIIGKTINGAKNWLSIGEVGIQPSEFLKIATIICFSLIIERWGDKIQTLRFFIFSGLLIMVPIGIVLIQQDLGTSLAFFPIFIFIIITAGASTRHLLYLFLTAILTILFVFIPSWDLYLNKNHLIVMAVFNDKITSALVFGTIGVISLIAVFAYQIYKKKFFYFVAYFASMPLFAFTISMVARLVLKEYQIKRLLVFLDPYFDAKGSGWNIIQSLTAVGSGGFSGKGYLQGTQSHLQFLPEQSTDFIFSIISEEWGFLGAIIIFACFFVIFFRMMNISIKAKDNFGSFIASGVAGVLFFHMLVNIGMTIGVMPVTGIPLPLVSYGGSSLWAMLWAFGIIMSINSNRYQF